ncbi:hypothetical protein H6G00_01780 [Leptolyngbya sp. FACHB-541]|uniref:hypothetical protein n=1 Tax=Leptolyngbya sp. FACHB-541 TaxID=2692810 RepID=UPI0016862F29|nr:hypothetical protein [Leptolyngbya sp. FACHB-541]MBD1995361.1 hypothetical protein [Leptolyngbya sp. FACHB-541]
MQVIYEKTELGLRPWRVGESISPEYEVLSSHCEGRDAFRRNDAGGTEPTSDPCPFIYYKDGEDVCRLELDLLKCRYATTEELAAAKTQKQWVEPGLKFRLKLDVEGEPFQLVWAQSLTENPGG